MPVQGLDLTPPDEALVSRLVDAGSNSSVEAQPRLRSPQQDLVSHGREELRSTGSANSISWIFTARSATLSMVIPEAVPASSPVNAWIRRNR